MIAPHARKSSGSWTFGTRALRIVASAHIPTGKLQWKRRLVSARNPAQTSRDWDYCSTAGLHGQARCNSQNLLSVAIDIPVVNCFHAEIVSQATKFLTEDRLHNSPQFVVLPHSEGLGPAFVRDPAACRNIRSASTLKNSDENYFFGLILIRRMRSGGEGACGISQQLRQ